MKIKFQNLITRLSFSCRLPDIKSVWINPWKVHIDCKKGAQISILANKIGTQRWPNMILRSLNKLYITFFYFFIFLLLCSHYVADLIKKLELHLMVVSVLLKIKFRQPKISVPKIGILKTACMNPCNGSNFLLNDCILTLFK